jgi:hypothetical protein
MDGDVWTWARAGRRWAMGPTCTRSTPALAWTAPGRWSPPQPMLSLASGTYAGEQVVLITSAVSGAALRYTTNWQDLTESDPEVPVTGDVLMTASTC